MKTTIKLLALAFVLFATACSNDDEYDMLNSLWRNVTQNEARIDDLEKWCAQANTNITSLQTIVNVLESNGMVTSITPVMEGGVEIGYTITFSNHDPITIYHGKDGKDGQNGANGQNGTSPIVGVAKYTDGVYYWTLNGEWLLDDNGNKLPVSGKDGQNGADGKDGQDGADGKDGITPLLKIENGYWYISYDNGATWTESGKATGDNGQDGQNGTDGKDGQDGTNGQDGVTPLLKIENGYWYISYDNGATWAQLGKATGEDGKDGANGTNGTDGKDGQDGADGSNGQDGITPQLKIENGYWYVSYDNGATWTQFGKATGADGQDGQNGTDGKDGQDGQDGKDGVTPQLKIEEGYWFISYDNGVTWTQLGKATGEDGQDGKDGADGADGKDGQNGADGKDGQDGDSMFQSVTQDENYVYFTLADGTVIKIAKASEEEQPNSEFMFIVTYDANGGVGTMKPDTFYYGVSKQLSEITYTKASYTFASWNTKANGTGIAYADGQELMISKNITLYAQWTMPTTGTESEHVWIDLGLSVKWATCNVGATKPEEYGDYFAWGETSPKTTYNWNTYKWATATWNATYNQWDLATLTKYNTDSLYGTIDNKRVLELADDAAAVNWGGAWRMPTVAEWRELLENCTWTWTSDYNGTGVKGQIVTSNTNGNSIFLPAAGSRDDGDLNYAGRSGDYWSISFGGISMPDYGWFVGIYAGGASGGGGDRKSGNSVRPVLGE